jgi:hypothetical protein
MSKLYFCYNNKNDYYDEINFILENPTFETSLIFFCRYGINEAVQSCDIVEYKVVLFIYLV